MLISMRAIPNRIARFFAGQPENSRVKQDFPKIGVLNSGPLDAITDVAGVRVGHCTLDAGPIQTGVTVVVPNADPFLRRPLAGQAVFNGFGKTVGLMQVAELGYIETPLALTNTFSVGTVAEAQIRQAIFRHREIGREWTTVNPLVAECNDGYLNDIQSFSVRAEHYDAALKTASAEFAQGSVGAGRGMSCFGLKGGIGSASRVVECDGRRCTVGVLVLANFGKSRQCILAGRAIGGILRERLQHLEGGSDSGPEKGSIIVVLATDAPLDSLQLTRLARRAGNGLARTGSICGHGSGDLSLAFSTSQFLPWPEQKEPTSLLHAPDHWLEFLFQAAVDATEQAIIKALFLAETVRGRDGHCRHALVDVLPDWRETVQWRG